MNMYVRPQGRVPHPAPATMGGATMGQDGSTGGWRFARGSRATCGPVLTKTFVPVSLTFLGEGHGAWGHGGAH